MSSISQPLMLWVPFIFQRDAIRFVRLWSNLMRVYVVSGVVSLQGVERSEEKTQAQQIVDFFQEADDGLGLGNEAIDGFELAHRQAIIARQERDRNIRFGILHARRGHTAIHFWHEVVEEH